MITKKGLPAQELNWLDRGNRWTFRPYRHRTFDLTGHYRQYPGVADFQFNPLSSGIRLIALLPAWDPDSNEEQRFVTLESNDFANFLIVVYTCRELDIIRIISAWKANQLQSLHCEKDRC